MMKKTAVLVTALLLTTMLAVAQDDIETLNEEQPEPEERPEVSTGWFTPDSALYGLETAWDNAGMAAGFKSPGDVAEKRAAEAEAMINANNSEAAEKATRGLEKAAERAGENDIPGLERAQTRIQTVMENAPEEAQEGLQNALENVQSNRDRAGGPPGDVGPDSEEELPGESGAVEDAVPEEGEQPAETEENRQDSDASEEQETDAPQPDEQSGQNERSEESDTRRAIVIENEGNSFTRDRIEVEAGQEIEILFANTGGEHDLVIPELGLGTDLISGGERDSFTHTFEETGEYEFLCSVPGHSEQGMTGTLEVVEG